MSYRTEQTERFNDARFVAFARTLTKPAPTSFLTVLKDLFC
jgi:hypothetical protein